MMPEFIPILAALVLEGQFIGKNGKGFIFNPVLEFLDMPGCIKFKCYRHQEEQNKRDQKINAE